jgi:hypothetical protein
MEPGEWVTEAMPEDFEDEVEQAVETQDQAEKPRHLLEWLLEEEQVYTGANCARINQIKNEMFAKKAGTEPVPVALEFDSLQDFSRYWME